MVKRLLKSLREFKKPAIITMLVMAGEVLMESLIPYVMAELIDEGFEKGNTKVILITGALLLLFSFVSLFFGCAGSLIGARAATGFSKNLREDMYKKVQKFSFANIDKFSTASIITRLTTDVTRVQNTFSMCIRMAVRTPLTFLFSVAMTFFISWKIGLIMLALLPVLVVAMVVLMKKVFPIFKRMFKRFDKLNNVVQENLRGIRVVKSFVREEQETEKFRDISQKVYEDSSLAEKILAWNSPVMTGILYVAMLIVAWVATYFIVGNEPVTVSFMGTTFTVGLLNSILTYSMQILSSCMMLSMLFVMITMARESMVRIDEVLTEVPTIQNPENAVLKVADGSVTFEHVNFSYSGDENKLCLLDANLQIPSGKTVGIIGGTGSAKSTLVQLIPRLYDVTSGSVKVGGRDVREYDLKTLRDAVSMVLQQNTLFYGTVKDNMRWGNPDATDEEIVTACRHAAADSFVMEFPDGYDTVIEQGGSNVSGGQRQRLCIARALLKKPQILILDDSTSAVDTATDALIRKSFKEDIPDTTKLIIAQRISSVQDADMIIVLDNGRINAIGSHEELLASNAIYKEVYESQQKGGKEDE